MPDEAPAGRPHLTFSAGCAVSVGAVALSASDALLHLSALALVASVGAGWRPTWWRLRNH